MEHFSQTAKCERWGSDWAGRRVSFLTLEERQLIKAGELVTMWGPDGEKRRIIAGRDGRFYCRKIV